MFDWKCSIGVVLDRSCFGGGGDTAHVFDDFAPSQRPTYHVYGITGAGFGAFGYARPENPSDRLGGMTSGGDDAVNLHRPVLVGPSIAGAE